MNKLGKGTLLSEHGRNLIGFAVQPSNFHTSIIPIVGEVDGADRCVMSEKAIFHVTKLHRTRRL